MLRRALLTAVFLLIAIGGGAASLWLVLEKAPFIGSQVSGPWVAFPVAGTPDADPYSRARHIRTGGLALGSSEGIVFTARQDSAGNDLRGNCTYSISGIMPLARFWTLHLTDLTRTLLPGLGERPPALHSRMALLASNNHLAVSVSPRPLPGNWIPSGGDRPLQIVLILLDAPIATGTPLTDLVLPTITRVGCDA